MRALTLRLEDAKHARLKQLAQSKGISINRLLNEMATLILAEFDLKTQFKIRAKRGKDQTERGLVLLQKARREE